MDIKNIHIVYFLGVGGIGMSAIARFFLANGSTVYGYDKTKTPLTQELEKEGAKIHYNEDVALLDELLPDLKKDALIVYTPAIPSNNEELIYFRTNNLNLYKRSEVLGLISQHYFTIAIAGTHGKTTTSSMVAHVLDACGINCVAFLGGISLNFNSNLLLNENAKTLVVEADEFDRSFLTLSPDIALITSLDADHLDVYEAKDEMVKSYQDFVRKIKKDGLLITKPDFFDQLQVNENISYNSYSIDKEADCKSAQLSVKQGSYFVDVDCGNQCIKDIELGLPGIHNVENAIGAYAIAKQLNISAVQIKEALASYKGVKRRFEYHVKSEELVYIDDYAHHPTEIEFCVKSVRELYPNKKITAIFQPHLYSRTRDFVNEFAESLSLLDELVLLPIYPARELPIEGITSSVIYEKVTVPYKIELSNDKLLNYVESNNFEVLLTLGAGNIDVFIQPITQLLTSNLKAINE